MSEIVNSQSSLPAVRGGIIGLQHRMREIGRIRIGVKDPSKGAPKAIPEIRLTSKDRKALEAAAEVYGGEVKAWNSEWELITNSEEIDVYASQMPMSQHYELWSGGGCQRRCNGEWDEIRGCPCDCALDSPDLSALRQKGKACKLTTRISLILAKVPGIGVWRLDTGSVYAAMELPLTYQGLQMAARTGRMIPARLAAPMREVKRGGETKKFRVVELRIDMTMEQVQAIAAGQSELPYEVDASTGEALPASAPALEAPVPAPTAAPAPRVDPDHPAVAAMREHGLDKVEDASQVADLKRTCAAKGLDWKDVLVEAVGKGHKKWMLINAYAQAIEVPSGGDE